MRYLVHSLFGCAATALVWLWAVYGALGMATSTTAGIHGTYAVKDEIAARISEPRTVDMGDSNVVILEPKLLVVGGSGVLMGISAEQLEQALGVPTLNYGVYAGLDLPYTLHRARQVLQPGDTALLALEYDYYTYDGELIESASTYILERDRAYFLAQPLLRQLQIAVRVRPMDVARRYAARARGVGTRSRRYDPRLLNTHGDQTANAVENVTDRHRARIQALQPVPLSRGFRPDTASWQVLTDFIAWCGVHDVRVLATPPNILSTPAYAAAEDERFLAHIDTFYASHAVPWLGDPHTVMYGPEDMFDTRYHLHSEAVQRRTADLATLLHPYYNIRMVVPRDDGELTR